MHLNEIQNRPKPSGGPLAITATERSDAQFRGIATGAGVAIDQVGLIVPTSLCSGQIALMIAEDLNKKGLGSGRNISRFVALVHTEGCGSSSGENEEHYTRTLVGHLLHPFVKKALLLEHGCERTHNDMMRHVLADHGIDIGRFGYASVQLDGGIDKVVAKVEEWFEGELPLKPARDPVDAGLDQLSLGLWSAGHVPEAAAKALAWIAGTIVGSGGTAVIPENATLLKSADFLEALGLKQAPAPTLDYAQLVEQRGCHVMATPTDHGVETLTGLGGTGVQIILAHVQGPPLQGHPMIPVLQFTTDSRTGRKFHRDLDCIMEAEKLGPSKMGDDLLRLLCDTASHVYMPRLWGSGNIDFQVTRGLLGVSL